ncbi:MAG: DUF3168 domain-containing protein [Blastomonas sp.]
MIGESGFRAVLLDWLRGDTALMALVHAIQDEGALRATPPSVAIRDSQSAEWGVKLRQGREIRFVLEADERGEDSDRLAAIVAALEARIVAMPASQNGFDLVGLTQLRSRTRRRDSGWQTLLEYRARILAH